MFFFIYILLCDLLFCKKKEELDFHLMNFNVFIIKSATDNMRLITMTTIYRIMEKQIKALQLFSSLFAFSAPSPWRPWLHIKAQVAPTAACAETTVKFNTVHNDEDDFTLYLCITDTVHIHLVLSS